MLSTTLIVLSYNRPRMLREALESARGQADELILVDDGSDVFDAVAVAQDYGARAFVTAPPVPPDVRARVPRLGRLLNQAVAMAGGDVVGYLCDDDLLAPGWLRCAAAFLAANPGTLLTRGTWYQFRDGETPGDEPCPLDRRQMTAGNFAHRRALVTEHGACWSETVLTSHDDTFLWSCHNEAGVNSFAVPHCGATAGWRRLHAKNLILTSSGGHLVGDAAAFIAGRME